MPEEATFLSMVPAKRADWRLAFAVVAVSCLVFAAIAGFAQVPLAPIAAFIPAYEAALCINELITAILLFGQAAITRSRALLMLAGAYLFNAAMVVPHALTFPGLITPTGWLGAGPQSTAWLYMGWHAGFPLLLIAYVFLKRRDAAAGGFTGAPRTAIGATTLAVVAAVGLLATLATAGQALLPEIMQHNHYTAIMFGVVGTVWAASIVALGVLALQRPHTVLDLWLMVVMCAWIFDVALSAVLNAGRFDLGFYAGRIYGLFAASFVLLVLLLETRALYARLIRTVMAERAEVSRRAAALAEANQALRRSEEGLRDLTATLEARVVERTRSLEQAMAERHRASEMVEALVQQSALAILALDPERRVILWNPAAEKIFGYAAAEIIGQPYPLVPPEELAGHAATFERFAAGGKVQGGEVTRVRRDGSRIPLVYSGAPLYDPDNRFRGVVFMMEDATERKALEQQLRQSQKMEAIGQLTGGVAHDFNNLLSVIIGSMELLEERLPKGEVRMRELVATCIRAADRGAALNRSLLAFARRQSLNPSLVEANLLLNDIADLLVRTLGETIDIRIVLEAALWGCEADPGQLQNALINLAVNARDAMRGGGKLTIETSNVILDQSYVAQHVDVAAGDYVCLAVSDTGTGMPPEVIQRAFDPFFTTKAPGEGTGLGLSMVYGFLKQSNGHVKIYSEVGVGTTIKLYLPRARRAAESVVAASPEGADGGNEKILVVEDNDDVRQLVVQMLGSLGYAVEARSTATDALATLRAGANVDLMLTDVVLAGGMDGRTLAEAAQATMPRLKVLFMSGYTEHAILHQARLGSGAQLLQKPFRKADVAAKLRQVLQG